MQNATTKRVRTVLGDLSEEPIFSIITIADSVDYILVRVKLCISLPQSVLPKPGNKPKRHEYFRSEEYALTKVKHRNIGRII